MSAWVVRQWQVQRDRVALGIIIAGALANVAMLGAVGFGVLYEVGRSIGLTYERLG